MSYILDALRKADAQRERDPARGIHAQPTPLASASAMQGAASTRWLWIAGAAGVAVIGAAVWVLGEDKPAAPVLATPAPARSTAAAVAQAPAMPPAVMPPPAAPSVQPPPQVARAAPPRDPTNSSLPPMRGVPQSNFVPPNSTGPAPHSNASAAAAREAAFAASAGVPPRPAISTPAPAGPAPAAVPAPPAAAPAQPVSGLPPDAPRLVISGGVYSPSAAQRMLIVNGQVFNEGSEVAPGVALEEIKARTVVLKFRGARYTVAY
jgi:general secretion pathway protein B